MCAQCDNEDFAFELFDSVNVNGENYIVLTNDLLDTFYMMLSGVTYGDTYAGTVVIHTGALPIIDAEDFRELVIDGTLVPDVNASATVAYKGEASKDIAKHGHETMVSNVKDGKLPAWMTLEEQQQAVMYAIDYTDAE